MSNDGQIKTAEHDNMLCDVCYGQSSLIEDSAELASVQK
jgi:hypothetical protein